MVRIGNIIVDFTFQEYVELADGTEMLADVSVEVAREVDGVCGYVVKLTDDTGRTLNEETDLSRASRSTLQDATNDRAYVWYREH